MTLSVPAGRSAPTPLQTAARAGEATPRGTACLEGTERGKGCHSRGLTVGFKLQPNRSLAWVSSPTSVFFTCSTRIISTDTYRPLTWGEGNEMCMGRAQGQQFINC